MSLHEIPLTLLIVILISVDVYNFIILNLVLALFIHQEVFY